MWAGGSYDPALNLLFWGTGGPIPHSEIVRGTGDGAVLYTDSTLALDADTGEIVWYRQMLPRDNWNLDHVFEQVLVDLGVGGRKRPALVALGKPGIIWALDRTTGEVLWTRETTHQSRRPASDVADEKVLAAAEVIGPTLEGKTERQKNAHPPRSLAWLAWIVARLGGWNCYYKPPGPKTMRAGWTRLAAMADGYAIALAAQNE